MTDTIQCHATGCKALATHHITGYAETGLDGAFVQQPVCASHFNIALEIARKDTHDDQAHQIFSLEYLCDLDKWGWIWPGNSVLVLLTEMRDYIACAEEFVDAAQGAVSSFDEMLERGEIDADTLNLHNKIVELIAGCAISDGK